MKKHLFIAALALFGAAGQANATLNIEEGKPYVLRSGTSDFYFNMEIDGIGDGSSRHNAGLSANATTVYFHENPDYPGQWAICYSAEDASKCLGVGGQNGVSGTYWNAVINCETPFYWSVAEQSTADSGNPNVRISKASVSGDDKYLGLNSNDTPAEGTGIWCNKGAGDNRNDWELIPVAMPEGISLDPTKAYLMSLKGHDDFTLQMRTPVKGHASVSASIITPVRVVPKHDGTVAIVCCETGHFLSYNRWDSVIDSDVAASWTMSAVEDAGTTYYTLYQNGGAAGYLGHADASVADGVEIWTNVQDRVGEQINWKFTESELEEVNLTVNFQLDGVTYSTTVISGNDKSVYTISEFPPFTTGEPVTGTFSKSVTSIDVPVQVAVPFQYTATTDNMIWQGVTVHSNNKWFLKYTEDESITLVDKTENRINLNSPFADSELWAFVGNLTDGFKIYNKAAGTDKTLYKDGDNAKVGAATDNNQWKLMVSTAVANTAEACGFNVNNSNPMNAQRNELVLTWSAVDAGSTWQFYSLAEPMVNYYNATLVSSKSDCVGALPSGLDLTAVNEAKAAAEADPYNLEKAQAFHSAINAVMENAPHIEFDPAKWYRLENVNYGGYLVCDFNTVANIWGGARANEARTNHHSIVKFEAVPEQTDRYYIANQGVYFSPVTGSGSHVTQVEATENRGEFAISAIEGDATKHLLSDATNTESPANSYLSQAGDHRIVGGASAATSQWYIHPANDLDMTLSMQFDGKYVGTGYFPFPVKATGSAKLYYVTESTHKDGGAPVMTYKEVSSVPAATAFVVMNESNKVTLAIDYDGISAMAEPENVLAGTYRSSTATAGDYVFNGSAFEKSTDAPAIGSNSAYVPQTAVSDPEIESYSFVNPDMTTGIDEIGVATSGKQVIYDLQGRRVQRASKGLYIINGVKTLVK